MNKSTKVPGLERHVWLFRNGRNQALRIPREFEIEGNEAILKKKKVIASLWSQFKKGSCLPYSAPPRAICAWDEDLAPLDDAEF